MKLRATTSASRSRASRIFKGIGIALLVAIVSVTSVRLAQPVSADQYDDKIRALTADMKRYQAKANELNSKADSLQNALAKLTNQRQALQKQIDLSQAQYNKLVEQIAETEKEIKDNQDGLGTTLADLYVDSETSPLEMLASSDNISDFLNKQEYRNSVRDQLSGTIKRVKELKAQLDQQKADVTKVLKQQKNAKKELVAKETEQQTLLAQTHNSEAQYNKLVKDSAAKIAEARALQALLYSRSNSTGGYTIVDSGSLGGYPWNSSNCPMWGYLSTGGADGNGSDGRGYGCRQCASYAAYRVAIETGRYYNWGNGGDFARNAINAGYHNLGSNPQPGSIAVILGNPGHVAWVEAVSGSQVLVSQYNFDYGQGYGMYSKMWLSSNFFDQYVKII